MTTANIQEANVPISNKAYVWIPQEDSGQLVPADECFVLYLTDEEAMLIIDGVEKVPEKLLRPLRK